MKINKTVVIVGGDAGARISAEIFESYGYKLFFLETYAKDIDKKKIVGDKISKGIDFLKKNGVDYFIATGENAQRKKNFEEIFKKTNKTPINCIHKTASLSPSANLGYGNLVCPYAVIHTGAKIGNNTIINTASVIEHDCKLNDYVQVSPNATLCGRDVIGEGAFIGAGCVIIPKIKIGKRSVIAAGASVISDVPSDKLYAGVPAIFKKNI